MPSFPYLPTAEWDPDLRCPTVRWQSHTPMRANFFRWAVQLATFCASKGILGGDHADADPEVPVSAPQPARTRPRRAGARADASHVREAERLEAQVQRKQRRLQRPT